MQPRVLVSLLLAAFAAGSADAAAPPAAAPRDPALAAQLEQALDRQGPDYRPRSHHLETDGTPSYTNRLILEDSPYLLQHAHNPVDWYPWGKEAFAAARRQNKPIFLSIGYSTCHWCHVMERESFEDPRVAAFLNRNFISIKVDRERRPDVDEVYMTAVMLFSGHGGWPMSSFLTPSGGPFFGGTYYPRAQFLDLLQRVDQAWRRNRGALERDAERLAARVQRSLSTRAQSARLAPSAARQTRDMLLADRDEVQGGFGTAPKFPRESNLLFLLDRARRDADSAALETAVDALRHMDRGGIHDQVGGGFHRYSTTPDWLIPHFEKMLYNQALLARAYLQAWQLSGDAVLRRAAERALDYVLRDMRAQDGSFYSATDADSEGAEGRFFLWTPEQLRATLEPRDAALLMELFEVSERGNFEGSNILALERPLSDYAAEHELDSAALVARLDTLLQQLYQARQQRVPPLRDEKRLTAWNGMMITALAEAGRVLGQPRYLAAAAQAADAIIASQSGADGALWRVNYKGSRSVPATLDDYAHLIAGLLALYDANGDPKRLQQAGALADTLLARFGDPDSGALYMKQADDDPLFLRPSQASDGAVPSGNSVAIGALTALHARSGVPAYREAAEALLAAYAGDINQQPSAYPYFLIGAAALNHGGSDSIAYGAAGKVRVEASLQPPAATAGSPKDKAGTALTLDLEIAPGWHINSNQPLQQDLIASELRMGPRDRLQLEQVAWPVPTTRRLGFLDQPLSLYEGTVTVHGALSAHQPDHSDRIGIATVLLRLQACSDKICLPPETLHLSLPMATSPKSR